MKFNLKNRPKRGSMPYLSLNDDEKQEWAKYWKEVEDWYKGFEKELRERVKAERSNLKTAKAAGDTHFQSYANGRKQLFKEVLGE